MIARNAREDHMPLWKGLCALCAALVLGIFAAPVRAQDFPNRAIKMVVAFPAGGPTDFVARLLADKMKALTGQSVIIENKPGANAAIGADYVAKSEPDGYTVFFTTMGAVAINPNLRADLPYDPVRDFAPITLVVNTPEVLVVRPEMAVKTAKDLADYARSRPEGITMASTGVGSPPHLALELFQSAAKAKVLHVPYRGAAPAVTDVLGGQVDAMFADLPVLMPQIQAGKLKPIGTAASARAEVLPDVPTLDELSLPGVHVDNWYAMFAPAHTPAAIVAKLNAAVITALNDPELRNKLVQSGAFPAAGTPEALSEHLKNELARWGKIIKEKGIKSDT
jgi:tripartite-type tricarboxylate transporter receptor subunit TctC